MPVDTLEELALAYVQAEVALAEAKKRKANAEKAAQAIRAKFFEAITLHNMKTYHHAELGRFRPRINPHVSLIKASLDEEGDIVNEDARQQLEAWAQQEPVPGGAEGETYRDVLFYEAVRMGRLKQIVVERLEEGLDLPPGVSKYDEKTISWTDKPEKYKKRGDDGEREEAA